MKYTYKIISSLVFLSIVFQASAGASGSPYHSVVATDGSGDYTSIQAAIDAVPDNRQEPWLIFVKNGSYREQVIIPESKSYVHLIGQSKEKTVIHHCLNVGKEPSEDLTGDKLAYWKHSVHNPSSEVYKYERSVVLILAPHFYSENISYVNDWGVDNQKGPQALSLKTQGDCISFNNCNFRSFQDTWMTSQLDTNRLYVNNCHIEGAVDYFYGSGDALVENSTLYNVRKGSIIVAPSHSTAKYGYVFRNCIVDGNEKAAEGSNKLGRPWHNNPKTVYINTTVRVPLEPAGWTDMGGLPALFAEYNSTDINGNVLDLSTRKTEYTGRKSGKKATCRASITQDEAENNTYDNMIPGNDGWNPKGMMKKLAAPEKLKKNGSKVKWNKISDAIGYVVTLDDNVVAITKSNSVDLKSAQGKILKVRAVNRYGSLGKESELR